MNIQLVVPTKGCVNNCPFCCSKMHDCPYESKFDAIEIEKRMNKSLINFKKNLLVNLNKLIIQFIENN